MAENKDTKHNHYVPKTYMRNFSIEKEDKKGLFFINRLSKEATTEDAIKELSTTQVCMENNIYTLKGDTKVERMFIENFYNDNYEKHYSSIYNILTNSDRRDITPAERRLIISTVISMLFRTQKMPTAHSGFIDRVLAGVFQMAQESGKDFYMMDGKRVSIAGKTLEDHQKEIKKESKPEIAIIQLQVALRLIELRIKRDAIMVIKLVDESEFITSDNPVIYRNPEERTIAPFDIDNILTLPLDTKHQLKLIPDEASNNIFRFNKTGSIAQIAKLTSNHDQLVSSDKYMLGTDSGLRSYLSTKEEMEKPILDSKYSASRAEYAAGRAK